MISVPGARPQADQLKNCLYDCLIPGKILGELLAFDFLSLSSYFRSYSLLRLSSFSRSPQLHCAAPKPPTQLKQADRWTNRKMVRLTLRLKIRQYREWGQPYKWRWTRDNLHGMHSVLHISPFVLSVHKDSINKTKIKGQLSLGHLFMRQKWFGVQKILDS